MVEWAVKELEAAGVEEARLEAQVLLADTLGVSRASVIAQTYAPPSEEQTARYKDMIAQRVRRVPFAYVRGRQEFYGREFRVTSDVLIPRSETELLIDKVGELFKRGLHSQSEVAFADVGTGSGSITITLLSEHPNTRAVAYDISPAALKVATENARRLDVAGRVSFVLSDLLTEANPGSFDLVVSNPPYIPTDIIPGLEAEVKDYEPRLALDGGGDGLTLYRRLVVEAYQALKPAGWLYVEVGQGNAGNVADLMRVAGYGQIEIFTELRGVERIVCGQKPQDASGA